MKYKILFIVMSISLLLSGCKNTQDVTPPEPLSQKIVGEQKLQNSYNTEKTHIDTIAVSNSTSETNLKQIEDDLNTWILSHQDKTIVSLIGQPEQGGISGLGILYEDIKPSYHVIANIYSFENTRDIRLTKDLFNDKVLSQKRKIITACSISGWRGRVNSVIVISSPDYK